MITDNSIPSCGQSAFVTTQWTVVLEAARWNSSVGHEAFARLYLDYWRPLYAYVRRRGFVQAEAEDITQSFFARLLEKHALTGLEREGGRFRSFLLAALGHFLANEWDRTRAQKRGGGQPLLSLDANECERGIALEQPAVDTPATVFEKEWTLTLLKQVMERLRLECLSAGKEGFLEDVRLHLQGDRQGPSYAEVATKWGTTEGAVKVAVYRLRQRYGELLRDEIGRTVGSPAEVDEELRYLISVVAR